MLLSRHIARDPARLSKSGALSVLLVDDLLRQSRRQRLGQYDILDCRLETGRGERGQE